VTSPRVLLVGVGNAWRCDDAVGLVAARRLRERPGSGRFEVHEQDGDPLALLDAWSDADAVVVIDAVCSEAAPGTLYRIDVARGPLPTALRRSSSTHALGLADAIELARVRGTLPAHVLVYGVAGSRFEPGGELSPEVEDAVERVVDAALRGAHKLASRGQ
jgi:hydrogenase maturation protease